MADDPKHAQRPVRAREPDPVVADDEEDPGVLSAADMQRIRDDVRAKLRVERKKSAMQIFREQEERRLREVEGMVVGGVLDDMVTITLDLAKHSDKILVNMRPYWHGQTYTVSRHVANSLAEAQYRGWQHQFEIDGKSRFDFYQALRQTELSPVKGIKNAPRPPALPGQG